MSQTGADHPLPSQHPQIPLESVQKPTYTGGS